MTYEETQKVLNSITLGGAFEAWSFEFDLGEDSRPKREFPRYNFDRYVMCASFNRPDIDIDTGEVSTGYGREWIIKSTDTRKQIVLTCWLAAKQVIDHETHEAFTVDLDGAPTVLFDPHKSLDDLAEGSRLAAEGLTLP